MPGRRLVRSLVAFALAAALVLVACGGGGGGSKGGGDGSSGGLVVGMNDNVFNPDELSYSGGSVRLQNEGAALHNFSVQGHDVDVDVPAGGSKTLDELSLEPGTYKVICKYHEALGMTATLTVT